MKETFLSTRRLIGDVIFAVLLHKWLAVGAFLATAVLVFFAVFLMGPTYEGKVLLQVRSNPAQNLSPFADLSDRSSPVTAGSRALDVSELAKSRDIAEAVVKELGLDQRFAMRRTAPETPRDKINLAIYKAMTAPFALLRRLNILDAKEDDFLASAVDQFLDDTEEIEVIEDTQVIELTVGEETPALSMQGANRLADLVIAKLLELDRRETELAHQFAAARLPALKDAYAQAAAAVDEYRATEQVAALSDEKSHLLDQLAGFRGDAARLRAQQADLAARQAEGQRLLEAQVARLTSADLRNSLVLQQNELTLQQEGLRANLASLEASQAAVTRDLQALVAKEQTLTDLESARQQAQRLYLDMRDRGEKLRLQLENPIGEIDVRIADRAYISPVASPDWPMWIVVALLVVLLGGSAAVGLPLLVEYWSDRIERPIVITEQLDLPVLTPVPKL